MNDNSSSSSSDDVSDESELIKEYEKKTRKERCDKNTNVKEIVVDNDILSKIKISQNQLKKLKPKKERTPKQIEASKENIKKLLDLRKSKAEEAKIVLEVKPKQKYTRKKKEIETIEEEEEEEESKPKPKYQKKKPKIEDSSESEEESELQKKMRALKQLDDVLANQNPYYSLIMSRQMRR